MRALQLEGDLEAIQSCNRSEVSALQAQVRAAPPMAAFVLTFILGSREK